jgi:hypothetical protein
MELLRTLCSGSEIEIPAGHSLCHQIGPLSFYSSNVESAAFEIEGYIFFESDIIIHKAMPKSRPSEEDLRMAIRCMQNANVFVMPKKESALALHQIVTGMKKKVKAKRKAKESEDRDCEEEEEDDSAIDD